MRKACFFKGPLLEIQQKILGSQKEPPTVHLYTRTANGNNVRIKRGAFLGPWCDRDGRATYAPRIPLRAMPPNTKHHTPPNIKHALRQCKVRLAARICEGDWCPQPPTTLPQTPNPKPSTLNAEPYPPPLHCINPRSLKAGPGDGPRPPSPAGCQ